MKLRHRRKIVIPAVKTAVKLKVPIKKDTIRLPDPKTIEEDMATRKAQGIIQFDLTTDEFFEHPEKFWAEFKHTGQILVPEDLEKWLIGQPRMKEEFFLNLEEWVRKRLDVQKMREKGMADDKDSMKRFLKERPGPYLLYIGEPGCISGDSRVVLEDGTFARIQDLGQSHLQPIDVGLQTGSGIDRAKVFHIYHDQKTLRVTTASGREITGTPNHPMLTKAGWKRLDELSTGDFIASIENVKAPVSSYVKTGWARTLDVRLNHLAYETFLLPNEYTPDLGYMFGYWLGDGNKEKSRIRFYVADTEKEVVPELVRIMQSSFALSPKVYVRLQGGHNRKVSIHGLAVESNLFASFFSKGIPEFVFHSPDDVVARFLRGLFDSDGHITAQPDKRDGSISAAVGLKQKDTQILREVQMLLLRFGVHSRVYERSHLLKIADNWSVREFSVHVGFTVKHKADTLSEAVQQMKRLVHYDRRWDAVTKVEDAGLCTVYDLEVPETQSFLLAGLVSHNTGKSLLIKIANKKLKELYKKYDIKLQDVLLIPDPANKQKSKVKYVPAGMGKRITDVAEIATQGESIKTKVIRSFLGFVVLIGVLMIITAMMLMVYIGMTNDPAVAWFVGNGTWLQWLLYGMLMMVFPLMILWMTGQGGYSGIFSKSGANLKNIPSLVVDNSGDPDLYVDMTQANTSHIFGSVAHDPWQCLSIDNEIMTKNGWKKYGQVTVNDLALTFNVEENRMEWQRVEKVYQYPNYKGPMIEFKSQRLSLVVTPNHMIYCQRSLYGPWEMVEARELVGARYVKMLRVAPWVGTESETVMVGDKAVAMDDWLEFFGYWVAEGSAFETFNKKRNAVINYTVSIRQNPGEKQDRMLAAARRLGYNASVNGGDHIRIFDKGLCAYLQMFGHSGDKFLPQDVKDLPPRQLRILFDALVAGDGYVKGGGRFALYTKSERLAGDYQEIALKLGFSATIYHDQRKKKHNGYEYDSSVYMVTCTSSRLTPTIGRRGTIRAIPGDSPVWCIEVPNHIFMCRLDGKPVFTGNSGGLGTPTHHRMQAGVIHKADGKIMYFDEIKNFLMQEANVIEFLTVMEDGAYPIRGRSWMGGEGNASLAGESEPIDANFMIIAAGNYDSLPALDHYPALRDRFYYGNIVRAEDEVDASPLYQMQVAQFIADEVYRFKLPVVCEQGVKTIIGHARRRASSADKMKLMMRSYIQDLKKAAQFVWAKKEVGPCDCGIDDAGMIHSPHIMLAINDYAKPIEMQILDAQIKTRKPYKMMKNTGTETGQVNGLVVVGGSTGDVMSASAYVQELPLDDGPNGTKVPRVGVFEQTGLPVTDKDTWMQNSIRLVRTTIFKIYGIDLMRGYYTHIAFDQSDPKGVDGPSAGITMTLAIMSCLGDPRLPKEQRQPIPIRMDTAVTGTVENLPAGENDVRVGPIGGTFEKVYGAVKNGMKRVIIPKENYEHNYFESPLFRGLEVKMASSVLEYLDLMRADMETPK